MATIRERNGKFHVMIRKAGHRTLTQTFPDAESAQKWAVLTEAGIEKGDVSDDPRYKLSDAIDRFLSDPDRTFTKYEKSVLAWWRDSATNLRGQILGKKRLSMIRRSEFIEARDQIRAMKKHRGKANPACAADECDCPNIKPATVNRRMSAISAVLTQAIEWDWITTNAARIRRVTEKNERTRLLTPAEQKRLLRACEASSEPHMLAFVVTAMLSGARAGELVGLLWSDVDLKHGLARLTDTKNGTNRAVPVRGKALDLLKEMKRAEKVKEISGAGYVFKNATGYAPFYYRKAWSEIRENAKLEDFRFHDLRHLAASHLAMAGASQRELMEVLGHKSPAMTKRYSHFFDDHIADLGDRLQDRLFGDEKENR